MIRSARRIGIGVLLSAVAAAGVARLGEIPRAGTSRLPKRVTMQFIGAAAA
jgi:hypothetical protein